MAIVDLPLEVKDELLVLKRDIRDPSALRNLIRRGWRYFKILYLDAFGRIRRSLDRRGLDSRMAEFLSRTEWLRGEAFLHIDFRCRAYRCLWEAYRARPEDPEILGSLLRLELAHGKLKDASLHLFEARERRHLLPDYEFFEEELDASLREDVEADLWRRIRAAEGRLRRNPRDPVLLADLAAEYFYDVLDLERAVDLVNRALSLPCEDPETWYLAAEIAFEGAQPALALERLDRMLELAPQDYRGVVLQANVLASVGRYPEALGCLRGLVGASGDQPIRIICQDIFFQAPLVESEEYHRIWLQLLRREQVAEDGVGYFYSAGTPASFLEQPNRARQIYHEARRLAVRYREGDLAAEIDAGFRELVAAAPDYTFLLDEYARFLLSSFPTGAEEVSLAGALAEKAVRLAEAAGEPEARFRATLAAAEQVLGRG